MDGDVFTQKEIWKTGGVVDRQSFGGPLPLGGWGEGSNFGKPICRWMLGDAPSTEVIR